jgi:hypothetical protein
MKNHLPFITGLLLMLLSPAATTGQEASAPKPVTNTVTTVTTITTISNAAAITPAAPAPAAPAVPAPKVEKKTTEIWTLTFVPMLLTLVPQGSSQDSLHQPDFVAILVSNLNGIFQLSTNEPAPIRSSGRQIFITADEARRVQIKRILMLIDSPWPQVQMDFWPIQISGDSFAIEKQVNAANLEIQARRNKVQTNEATFIFEVQEHVLIETNIQWQLTKLGFDPDPKRPLTLAEAFFFLELSTTNPPLKGFPAVANLYKRPNHANHKGAMSKFIDDAVRFKITPADPDAAINLRRSSAVVDRLLKESMDAYTTHVQKELVPIEDFLQTVRDTPRSSPMLSIQTKRTKDAGVRLAGRTRLVVTSSLESWLRPKMTSFADTTQVKPYDFNTSGLSNLFSVSSVANPPAAKYAELVAKLLADVEPVFTTVAPGIEIDVRPTVLPDSTSARLKLYARFGVGLTNGTPGADTFKSSPADSVASHEMVSDVIIDAFDLFDISSFAVRTSHPQSPYYVPVLGRLPLLGQAFQLKRANKVADHVSIILVNAVIIPRSLDMVHISGF